MMDLDEEVRRPGFNSTSDSRDVNQHWGRHSQGQGSDGSTREQRASFHQTSPSHGDSLWLWLVMSSVTLMSNLLIRLGSRVIQEGCGPTRSQRTRQNPSVSLISVLGHKDRDFAWDL